MFLYIFSLLYIIEMEFSQQAEQLIGQLWSTLNSLMAKSC